MKKEGIAIILVGIFVLMIGLFQYLEATESAPNIDFLSMGNLALLMIILISGLVFYYQRKDNISFMLGIFIGCFIALLLYMINEFIVKNWFALLISGIFGGGIAVFTGGIGLVIFYFIGGFAILIPLVKLIGERMRE